MAYRLAYEFNYTGTSGSPMGSGDTFDFTGLSMISDGFGQAYLTAYKNAGSVNDASPRNQDLKAGEDIFIDSGTIGATGTAYRVVADEFDTVIINVGFYAPSDPGADANGLVYEDIIFFHMQLDDGAGVVRDFLFVSGTVGGSLVYDYPPVNGTLNIGTSGTLISRGVNINKVLDDQNRSYQQPHSLSGSAPCFVKGTRIQTNDGEKPIEDLRVGDMVKTRDRGFQPIAWIGSSTVAGTGKNAPVWIKAGTMGNTRDLYVSPNHRMVVSAFFVKYLFGEPEVLIAAKELVNDKTIALIPRERVTYFHMMFANHEIVFAEGAQSESLLITPYSLDLTAAHKEISELFPDILVDGSVDEHMSVRPIASHSESVVLKEMLAV